MEIYGDFPHSYKRNRGVMFLREITSATKITQSTDMKAVMDLPSRWAQPTGLAVWVNGYQVVERYVEGTRKWAQISDQSSEIGRGISYKSLWFERILMENWKNVIHLLWEMSRRLKWDPLKHTRIVFSTCDNQKEIVWRGSYQTR